MSIQIRNLQEKWKLLILVISACLLGSAFLYPGLGAVGFVAYAPLILFALESKNILKAGLLGLLFGTLYCCFAFSWIVAAYPADWLFDNPLLALVTLSGIVLALSFGSGVVIGLYSASVRLVWGYIRNVKPLIRWIFFLLLSGGLLALSESGRMWAHAIIFAAPWGIQPFLSTGSPAYLAASWDGIRQIARVGDMYSLTFVFGVINTFFALLYMARRTLLWAAVPATLLVLLGLNLLLAPTRPEESPKALPVTGVALAVPNGYDHLIPAQQALMNVPYQRTLIVYPEGFGTGVSEMLTGTTLGLIQSGHSLDSAGHSHSTATLTSSGREVQAVDKTIITTGGEYVPVVMSLIFKVVAPRLEQLATQKLALMPGSGPHPLTTDVGKVGILFCNEILSPGMPASLVRQGAQALLVLTSHVWFTASPALELQTKWAIQLRATANRVSIMQVAENGDSILVDQSGNILQTLHGAGILHANIPLRN